jgi:hypothetical protein
MGKSITNLSADEEVSKIAKLMGKKGGSMTLKMHGKKHYQNMAKKRWNKNK